MLTLLLTVLASCGKPEPDGTVNSLAASPQPLKEVRELCKTDTNAGEELCRRATEATNRRFIEDGKARYTPPKDCTKILIVADSKKLRLSN
ncbi:entry exclusion lipoprotein TrbK [Frateuria aurantia]